jgi:alanine racemase
MHHPDIPRRCWAEIDLGAMVHNARAARAAAGGGSDVMAVVKADAYGHGMVPVAAALEPCVDAFGVASVDEGVRLRSAGCRKPVMLLSSVVPDAFPMLIEHDLQASLSSIAEARALDKLAGEAGKMAEAHVVFDTGMGRIGFLDGQDTGQLATLDNLDIVGVASHYPCADEDEAFTSAQLEHFTGLVSAARLAPRWVHIANSAGAMGFPSAATNLVRAGLMIYGSSPLADHQAALQPALTWKSRITLLRDLPPGHGISYGRTFITQRDPHTRVATLGVGYGDGYPRCLSGKGAEVLVRGRRCPVLGRVTMDQIMVDVTELGDAVCTGDEVVLIGDQGDESILAAELARKAGTIAWEIFTGISQRVGREYTH